jgi:Zn-dependent peptidase ImmA (M78 family)
MTKIIRNRDIEISVESRFKEYEYRNTKINKPPIPIDRIIEDCGLNILYDKIEERIGENIFGGLIKEKGLVVINESHMELFKEKPGLERFTKAHELGHWDIYEREDDKGTDLFEFFKNHKVTINRNSGVGSVSVLNKAWVDENVYQAYKECQSRRDHPNVASAVNRYASSLLMPKDLLMHYTSNKDLTNWKNLYRLAEIFGVTISALCVRLQRLDLIFVKERRIYRTQEEAHGQKILNFW